MGPKKLSDIYEELRTAITQDTENPILALDREIHSLKRNPRAARKDLNLRGLVSPTIMLDATLPAQFNPLNDRKKQFAMVYHVRRP